MKRFLSLLMFVTISVASFAYDAYVHNLYFDLNTNTNEATVTYKYEDDDGWWSPYTGNVVIPDKFTYNGVLYSVTSIGDYAFYWCSGLTSVTIPNSVTSIGEWAFYDCSCLTSITIPNSVTSIGAQAFRYCSGLKSVTIPNSVTSIDGGAFYNCSGLKKIEIPNSVTSIGSGAFESCSGLTSITIPNSVTSIGNDVFYGCSGLTSITIPNSVTSIGSGAFKYCSRLTSIDIPNSVTSIGSNAFSGCSGLTSITIPNSVTSIGNNVFYGCSHLIQIYSLNPTPPSVSNYTFSGVNKTATKVYVPSKAVDAYKAAEYWKEFSNVLPKPLDILNIADGKDYSNTKPNPINYDELTFTKTFSTSGNWNAFYVPISINVEDYAGELDFAEIYAFCAMRDTNWDGVVDANDENFLYVNPVKTGCTKPNAPYMIRPKEAKTYAISSADNILYPKTNGKVEFSTSHDNFTVTGLNEAFTVTAGDNNYYVSASGTLNYRTIGSTTVKANRWIMHRESKDYGEENLTESAAKASYRIVAIGEDIDETTAIETIKMQNAAKVTSNAIYTLDGRKVNSEKSLPAGIYIKNGKKFIVK